VFFILSPGLHTYTYHSRFISEGVAEASQILTEEFYENYSDKKNTADVTGGKPIAI
jgi:hypothetical protein